MVCVLGLVGTGTGRVGLIGWFGWFAGDGVCLGWIGLDSGRCLDFMGMGMEMEEGLRTRSFIWDRGEVSEK